MSNIDKQIIAFFFAGVIANAHAMNQQNGGYQSYVGNGQQYQQPQRSYVDQNGRLVVPYGIIEIRDSEFFSNANLREIVIPDSVTRIGVRSFSLCSNVTSISLGNGLREIHDSAFACMRGMRDLVIPASVTRIGKNALLGINFRSLWFCNPNCIVEQQDGATVMHTNYNAQLQHRQQNEYGHQMNMPQYAPNPQRNPQPTQSQYMQQPSQPMKPSMPQYTPQLLQNDESTQRQYKPQMQPIPMLELVKPVTIPVLVKEISERDYATSLKSINIPTHITKINNHAFLDFKALTAVTIPSSVVSIGMSAFYNCTALKNLVIPNNVSEILDSAFKGCESLASFSVPTALSILSKGVLRNCSGLKAITIPSNIVKMSYNALSGCSGLTRLDISSNLVRIDDGALSSCYALTKFEIPTSVTYLGRDNFVGWNLTSITIPSQITSIEGNLFGCCKNLKNVLIEGDIKSIGYKSFSWTGLERMVLPNSVTRIDGWAFAYCDQLAWLSIADNVHIDKEIFGDYFYAPRLARIDIRNVIGEQERVRDELIAAHVPAEIINIVGTQAPVVLRELEIPAHVRRIAADEYTNMEGINKVVIPSRIKSLGNRSFSGCFDLKEIDVASESIGKYVFYGLGNVTSIVLRDGVTRIRKASFSVDVTDSDENFGPREIVLPDSLCRIGRECFACLNNVTHVSVGTNLIRISRNFMMGNDHYRVTVRDGRGKNRVKNLLKDAGVSESKIND